MKRFFSYLYNIPGGVGFVIWAFGIPTVVIVFCVALFLGLTWLFTGKLVTSW